jgi:hypothetical protein
MFTSKNFKEANENHFEMVDFDRITVEKFLMFLYYPKQLDLEDFTPKLLLIAEKYNVKKLLEEYEKILTKSLDSENVFQILKVAFLANQNLLIDTASEFLFKNPKNLIRKEWIQLNNEHPSLYDTLGNLD